MAQQPTASDIDFVIARGEALVNQARDMVARWEQGLVQMGITPEMAARLQQGPQPTDLQTLVQAAQRQALSSTSTAMQDILSPSPAGEVPEASGPSLQDARRAARRLRHV